MDMPAQPRHWALIAREPRDTNKLSMILYQTNEVALGNIQDSVGLSLYPSRGQEFIGQRALLCRTIQRNIQRLEPLEYVGVRVPKPI